MENDMRRAPRFLAIVFCVGTIGTESRTLAAIPPVRAESATAKAEASTPPAVRLPAGARPTRYAVDLTLSPESESFSGVIDIELTVERPLRTLWLNATDISVSEAMLSQTGRTVHPRVVPGGDQFVGLVFDESVGTGPSTLRIAYAGKVSAKELSGIFRQKEGDDWYILTQFEPTDARKAFPCFDEPGFKVPWQITLRVKKELVAVSNAPIASEMEISAGMKAVRFAETKPLPSYLIALGVGPFEILEGPRVGSKKVPFRVLVPKGQRAQAAYTVQATPEILSLLEKYFGTPYPYEKLDFLAIPLADWAMENAGLITFGRRLILSKPEDETLKRQRQFGIVAAHELAHMWFGDLVTMKWWDDIWLNEAFAQWMETKIVEEWKPGWDVPVTRVKDRIGAMGNDRLVSARQVRQPIESDNDIQNAFDGITYAKGAAVLTMLERWIGADRFQKGVQRHLSAHAWGNADAADFFASLSVEAGKDVAPVFSTFVDQSGVPLVTASLSCSRPILKLTQKRFLPLGSTGSEDRTWKIPVCVHYGVGAKTFRQCSLLTGPTAEIPLEGATGCPEWLLPNDGASGYYVARIDAAGNPSAGSQPSPLAQLFDDGAKRLSVPERVGVLGDLSALASSGEIPLGDVLSLIPTVARDGNRHTLEIASGIVDSLRLNLVPDELLPNYRRYVRNTFGVKARALGFASQGKESEDTRLLRPILVSLVAKRGEDKQLQKEALPLALKWLEDHGAIEAEMVDAVLSTAARSGDRALFDRVHAAARKTQDRTERAHLLNAMGSFQDPELVQKRIQLLLTDEFDIREAGILMFGGLEEPALREKTYAFLKANYDTIAGKLPKEYEPYLAFVGGSFCDEAHRKDIEAFFGERTSKAPGGPRILAQVLEQVDLCIARKKAQEGSVEVFLRKQ
jgi:alanyl aminopeptidase